jgi:hypothetical protein
MTLSAAKRRHLVSAYATVSHMLQQMEEAARDGRSPTGVGAPLTPLPEAQAEAIVAPVRQVKHLLRQAAMELAPLELAELERPQSLNNTLVWLSNLLDGVRVSADDLHPRKVRKYGELGPAEEAMLGAVHRELLQEVQLARDVLDALVQGVAKAGG